jgi:SRSO17 transposase
MVAQDGTVNPATGGWSEALEELHRRIAGRFARSEAREQVRRYLVGLLGRVERKNGWQLAEAIGETDPQGVQRLLNSAKWDADLVRNGLREYAVEHLGDLESGVLITDETGFLKKGQKGVGVAHQYTRTAGDMVDCQKSLMSPSCARNWTRRSNASETEHSKVPTPTYGSTPPARSHAALRSALERAGIRQGERRLHPSKRGTR